MGTPMIPRDSQPLRSLMRTWGFLAVTGLTLSLAMGCTSAAPSPSLSTTDHGYRLLTIDVDADPGFEAEALLSGRLTLSPHGCVVVEDGDGTLLVPMFRDPVDVTFEDGEHLTFTAMNDTFHLGDRVTFGGGDFTEPEWAEECGARTTFRVHTTG
jgi:hypothetical protein